MSIHLYVQKDDWKKFYERIDGVRKEFKQIPEEAVKAATALVVRRIKLKIGEKKLVRSGTYRRSINGVVRKIADDVSAGYVGTWVEYAKWLEEGTKRMRAYRVFEETMAESFDDIIEILLKEVKDRAVRRG